MSQIVFLTLEQVLAIHHDQIERYGGSHGLRDLNLLESAIERPKASFMGEEFYSDIFEKAAALLHSLLLNHPFLDGNKRTSICSGARFLFINGFNLNADQEELVSLALQIESKKMDLDQIASWFKEHSSKK